MEYSKGNNFIKNIFKSSLSKNSSISVSKLNSFCIEEILISFILFKVKSIDFILIEDI